MKRTPFYFVCFATLLAVACAGQSTNAITGPGTLGTNSFPFVEKHDLNSGTARGYVTLTIEKPVVEAGKPVTIEVRLVNTGMSRDFFNPYFKGLIAAPGQIALYDGNHNYLCDDKPWVSPSARGYSWDDWTFIPGGGSYIGFFSLLTPNYYRRPLPPGDYYLQIIYYKALIGLDPPWSDTDPDVEAKRNRLKDFEAHYDHSELFRSNPVKITITK